MTPGHGATPTPERLVAVLAQVHKALGAATEDLDMDPARAACVQLGLAGPHLAPSPGPVTRPPLTMSGRPCWSRVLAV